MDIEAVVRDGLARVLESDTEPTDINPDLDMAEVYGLTSLNKVIFLMSVCDDTNVSLPMLESHRETRRPRAMSLPCAASRKFTTRWRRCYEIRRSKFWTWQSRLIISWKSSGKRCNTANI